ncbi:hypothetical protein [Paraliomyxa miuraensis]|uniref:hypothetical protein n=1 Tax=Paraliomyxa miuraensis TaxID=376150 RepID=UPI002251E81D|nr:hypothetical protein [Paraliomyxa miuraensis]MCX4240147.1 hypothetical protein [Paraliomyxa miuraensis]
MTPSLTLVALLVAGSPAGADASPSESTASSTAVDAVRFEVDHSALLDQQMAEAAEASARFVREDAVKALGEQHGVAAVDDRDAPAVVVRLSWKDYENSVYRIEILAQRPGESLGTVEAFEANCINDTALAEAVVGKLGAALAVLEEPEPQAEVGEQEPKPGPGTDHGHETAPPETPDDRPRKPLGVLGRAGIGVAVVGVGTLVSGGILFAVGERFDPSTRRVPDLDGRNFAPPGVALMVTGGAALAAGAILLLVDRTQAKQRTAALLLPSPGGLSITGRF